jgi:hypothetical protein
MRLLAVLFGGMYVFYLPWDQWFCVGEARKIPYGLQIWGNPLEAGDRWCLNTFPKGSY